MGDVQYPWEQEEEKARTEQARRLEEAVASNWKASKRTRSEEISRYGLQIWLYFQVLSRLTAVFSMLSLLAVPKLVFVLQGGSIHQHDPLAWLARISLGNVSPEVEVELGPLNISLDSAFLTICDAVQWIVLLAFLAWFRFSWMARVVRDPDIRELSAADYAVQVEWLPPRQSEQQNYEWDLVRHFEVLLRELDGGDPHALVCQAALVRDFGDGLLSAQERKRLEEQAANLADLPNSAGRLWPDRTEKRIAKLKARIEVLSLRMRSCRADEAERPVRRAYVILATQADRARLLQEYRFARVPILGRCFQATRLRYVRKWPLRLTPAPDPGDIMWEHFSVSLRDRTVRQGVTLLFLVLIFLQAVVVSCFAWWGLLSVRGKAAAQCTLGDPLPNMESSVGPSPCLSPPLKDPLQSDLIWAPQENGCDCFCVPQERWWTSPKECYALGSLEACIAGLVCTLTAEVLWRLLTTFLPKLLQSWRPVRKAQAELVILRVLACTASLTPFATSLGYLGYKILLDQEEVSEFSEPLVWELDRGWYLHCAPTVMLWCLWRWLGPALRALGFCCRTLRRERVLRLQERYATLAAALAVTVALQPLVPCLVPLAALGLLMWLQSEKYLFLRGGLALQPAPCQRTTLRVVHSALGYIWFAVGAGSVLSIWVLGHRGVSGEASTESKDFMARASSATALPAVVSLCLCAGSPLIAWVWAAVSWLCGCPGGKAGQGSASVSASVPSFQEAWLRMIHSESVASYQLHEQPGYKDGKVLEELQVVGERSVLQSVPSYLSRGAELNSSLAAVGASAPSRSSGKKTAAADLVGKTAPASKVPRPPPEGLDIFSQLRTAPAASSGLAVARKGMDEGQPALTPMTMGAWSGQSLEGEAID